MPPTGCTTPWINSRRTWFCDLTKRKRETTIWCRIALSSHKLILLSIKLSPRRVRSCRSGGLALLIQPSKSNRIWVRLDQSSTEQPIGLLVMAIWLKIATTRCLDQASWVSCWTRARRSSTRICQYARGEAASEISRTSTYRNRVPQARSRCSKTTAGETSGQSSQFIREPDLKLNSTSFKRARQSPRTLWAYRRAWARSRSRYLKIHKLQGKKQRPLLLRHMWNRKVRAQVTLMIHK